MVEKRTSLIPQYHAKEYAKDKFERRVYIGCILVIVLATLDIHIIPISPRILSRSLKITVIKREKVSIYLFSVILVLGFWK